VSREQAKFRVRPEDARQNWAVARTALRTACEAAQNTGKDQEVIVRPYKKRKTLPQNRTLWMWHREVASQLNERGRMLGHSVTWSADEFHDLVFKPRWMPAVEKALPDGTVASSPMGTSDPDCTTEILSNAMEQYLSWIYTQGMEITIPEDPELEAMVRRCV